MASSVARMPSEDWRDPGRLFGPHAAGRGGPCSKGLKKVLVREPPRPHAPATSSSPRSKKKDGGRPSRREAEAPAETSAPAAGEEPSSPATARKRQILDRWAAQQAREMITTIERQAHEAELSALTTTTQPVSARAACLLRESSPAPSEASNAATTASSAPAGDLMPNVRASSLIQMWRELEAEAGLTPTHRTTSGGSGSAANAFAEGGSDACEDSEAFGDWESDLHYIAPSEPANSASVGESERGRVVDIVKMLSSGNQGGGLAAVWNEDYEPPLARENSGFSDQGDGVGARSVASSAGNLWRSRGRQEIEGLLARRKQERDRELSALAERQAVSRFSYRGRLQSMLRLRSLRRVVAVQDQQRTASAAPELAQLQAGATISSLRQRFNHQKQHCGHSVSTGESSGSVHVQSFNSEGSGYKHSVAQSSSTVHVKFPVDSQGSGYPYSADQSTSDNNRYQEIICTRDAESTPPELGSPCSRSDDLQEGSHSPDGSWDERNLWLSSPDWQRNQDSSPAHDWQGEVVIEEPEAYEDVENISRTWISETSNSWRGWEVRQAVYHDLVESFSDNVEIRELLERRRVSTSLASDFCDRMNRLIMSFLNRQGQQCYNENSAEDYECQPFWRQNDEDRGAGQVESASSSLVPLPYHAMHQPDSWHYNSFTRRSSQNLTETEAVHDLRSDMAQIHHEISELRKLVESCMEWQANLQHSIKKEVSDAVRQSVGVGCISDCSKSTPGRKGSCCICYEMQVDSLLYRCGHMCTCFKCANELQWSSGKCPICRSPIVDVVRAYPHP